MGKKRVIEVSELIILAPIGYELNEAEKSIINDHTEMCNIFLVTKEGVHAVEGMSTVLIKVNPNPNKYEQN